MAHSVTWFVEGAFRPEGFSTDFDAHYEEVRKVGSLEEALEWWQRAMSEAIELIGSKSDAELDAPLPEGIMGGLPGRSIIDGISDHNAHHRGSLAVYARLCGHVPDMPYGD